MKRITVVGVGALGSHALMLLRNSGTDFRVIDYDRVEQKNVLSQFHGKTQVGKNKCHSVSQTMNFLFGTKMIMFPHKLTADNDTQLLGGSDLILDCLDNGEARRVVQNYARKTNTPCVHGALAADGGFGRVVWDSKFVIDDVSGGAATCEDGAHLPFISITASYLAKAAQDFLVHGKTIGYQIHPQGVFAV